VRTGRRDRGARLRIGSFSGEYRITDGRVGIVEGDVIPQLDGLREKQLSDRPGELAPEQRGN
jgi:hypothetical protein